VFRGYAPGSQECKRLKKSYARRWRTSPFNKKKDVKNGRFGGHRAHGEEEEKIEKTEEVRATICSKPSGRSLAARELW
jgi:hypothetical protein